MKLVILLSIFTMLSQASTELLEVNNNYNSLNKQILELIRDKGKRENKHLLIPINSKNTFNTMYSYENIYKKFIDNRKILKRNKKKNELYTLYLYTFKDISKNIISDSVLLISRYKYEMRILKKLKKDLSEEQFLYEKKDLLMTNIKKLLSLDKFMIYESQKRQNIFYAKNMKQYLSLKAKVPLQVIENSDMYIKFLHLLNEGATLINDGVKANSFKKFENFVEIVRVSNKDIQDLIKIKNENMFMNRYINYWIRGQVYGRYLLISSQLIEELKCIEKEKTFFDELFKNNLDFIGGKK